MITPLPRIAQTTSQPPPGGTKGVTQSAKKAKQPGKADPQTPASPVAVVPQQPVAPINPDPQTAQVAPANKQQTQEQVVTVRSLPPIDTRRDWVDYSGIAMTVLLFAVAIAQIVLLRHTLRATMTAARAARLNASAAKENAIAARYGADETKRQNDLIAGQGADIKESIQQAARSATAMEGIARSLAANVVQLTEALSVNREISETNKRIAELTLTNSQAEQRARLDLVLLQFPKFGVGHKPLVSFQLMNSGRTPAKITGFFVFVLTEMALPQQRDEDPWMAQDAIVPPGRTATLTTRDTSATAFTPEEWERVKTGEFSIAIYGAVKYEAGFGIIGEVGFGANFDPSIEHLPLNRRFSACGIPGYGYST